MIDTAIIGAGPAGMTAALYARRAGLEAVVFDGLLYGGQAATTSEIENYPAIEKISGPDFSEKIYDQALKQGAQLRFEAITSVILTEKEKKLVTSQREYAARTVIVAVGAKRRLLGVEGEKQLTGKGVSYCATCDGAFFRGKQVAVVGGGNTALEDALFLANVCEKVWLVHRRDTFRADKSLTDALPLKSNIRVVTDCVVERIDGERQVKSIGLRNLKTGERQRLALSGVFVAVGMEPDNGLFSGALALDTAGYIIAGEDCKTRVPGVYAAGDARAKPLRQIITAAADGAVAASAAASFLNLQS